VRRDERADVPVTSRFFNSTLQFNLQFDLQFDIDARTAVLGVLAEGSADGEL
jgi:hypothetical protein